MRILKHIALIGVLLAITSAMRADTLSLPVIEGEYWWGAATDLGPDMPLRNDESTIYDLQHYDYNNQTAPLLLSSKGRYLWADGPITVKMAGDMLHVDAVRGHVHVGRAGSDLAGAYDAACKNYFPPQGNIPPQEFFTRPIYNTWIELLYDQNQADVLAYAHALVDNGFQPGVMMIDDNWQKDYGDWNFRPDRFPDPKAMVDELHDMGFKVMLWVCPFVSPDHKNARDITPKGYLLRSASNPDEAELVRWWNGWSHVYDLSNPEAYDYLKSQLVGLQEQYGVDGFKFDGGDPCYYPAETAIAHTADALDVEQTRLWAQLAEEFPYNELRSCWGLGCRPLVQRLGDKKYSWPGVSRLVPCMIQAALLGHSYACPDMIGGGEYGSFYGVKAEDFDQTMFVRSCQIHALMPMMQFSVAPWRILSDENLEICRNYALLHQQLSPYILEMAQVTAQTGKPIVRHMAMEFPDEGLELVNDQYMLGWRYLVAPITNENNTRTVALPKGKWRDDTGKLWKGGRTITLAEVPLSRIPYFEKVK